MALIRKLTARLSRPFGFLRSQVSGTSTWFSFFSEPHDDDVRHIATYWFVCELHGGHQWLPRVTGELESLASRRT